MDPTGKVYVALQAPFWGNSPETVATQVLAEQLQIDPQDIVVTYSDSDHGLNGTGPGGSRFTVMLAGAVVGAAQQLKEKLIRIAAHMMEADASDLELRDGKVGVRGVPGMEKTSRRSGPPCAFLRAVIARRSEPHERARCRACLRPYGTAALRGPAATDPDTPAR